MTDVIPITSGTSEHTPAQGLTIDIDGYEGPLDLLLVLARTQKVDLRQISVLELAEQYLEFVEQTKKLRIELAADYLVMAAWLAFLKSRLLLPPDPDEDSPSGEDLAAHLAFQLERLEAMRTCAAKLMARDRLGREVFARGVTESVTLRKKITFSATLLDLMQAYARIRTKEEFRPYAFDRVDVYSLEQALDKMRSMIAFAGDWTDIMSYLPSGWEIEPRRRRSAVAGNFAASLELGREGKIEIKQDQAFAPILIRKKPAADD